MQAQHQESLFGEHRTYATEDVGNLTDRTNLLKESTRIPTHEPTDESTPVRSIPTQESATATVPPSTLQEHGGESLVIQRIRKRERNQIRYGLSMFFIIAVVSVLSLLRGGKAGSQSILGFDACSTPYWLITIATFLVCLVLTIVYGVWLIGQERLKASPTSYLYVGRMNNMYDVN